MQALGLGEPEAFLCRLDPGHPAQPREMQRLAAILTTGETFFMRDSGQMRLLREHLLPDLLRARRPERRLRLWSAACASGEEAYSLAILMHELKDQTGDWRIEVYGTDLNRAALRRAASADYGDWSLRGADADFRERWFDHRGHRWVLKSGLRDLVRFHPLDLIHDPLPDPARGLAGMDLILCRNLLIYLEPEAALRVAHRLSHCLRGDGVLVTGHGELLGRCPDLLAAEVHPDSVVYRRRTQHQAAAPKPAPAVRSNPAPAARPAPAAAAGPDALRAAWRLADAGHLSEALARCRDLLARAPLTPEPHLLAGVLAMELGDRVTAREDLRRAIYLAPDLIAAHVHLERLQSDAAETQAAERTRAVVARLLAALPADAPVPFLGEHRAGELRAAWARGHDAAPARTRGTGSRS